MKTRIQIAREEYAKCGGDRRTFMDVMIAHGLTKNGAATYFQNLQAEQRSVQRGYPAQPTIWRPKATVSQAVPAPVTNTDSSTPILTTPGLNEPRPLVLVLEVGKLAFSAAGSGKIVIDTLNRVLVNNARLLSANETSADGDRPNVLTVEIDAEITMGAFKAGKQVIENLNRVLGDRAAKLLAASEKY